MSLVLGAYTVHFCAFKTRCIVLTSVMVFRTDTSSRPGDQCDESGEMDGGST